MTICRTCLQPSSRPQPTRTPRRCIQASSTFFDNSRHAMLLILIAEMQLAKGPTFPYEPVKIFEIRRRSAEVGFTPESSGESDFRVSADTLVRQRLLEPRDVSEQTIDGSGQYAALIS